jgi:hypothetical protein
MRSCTCHDKHFLGAALSLSLSFSFWTMGQIPSATPVLPRLELALGALQKESWPLCLVSQPGELPQSLAETKSPMDCVLCSPEILFTCHLVASFLGCSLSCSRESLSTLGKDSTHFSSFPLLLPSWGSASLNILVWPHYSQAAYPGWPLL